MKRLIAFGLVLTALFACAGCKKQKTEAPAEMVSIYIPVQVTVSSGDGMKFGPSDLVYEKNWQKKDTFTVSHTIEIDGDEFEYSTVYGDKYYKTLHNTGDETYTEFFFNEKGQQVTTVSYFAATTGQTKRRTDTTYDDRGRTLKQVTKSDYIDAQSVTTSITYTYEDISTGSIGTAETEESVSKLLYDKEDRLICAAIYIDGEENTRTEYTYDENGCQIKATTYTAGVLLGVNETVYEKVEVSLSKAEKMPYFKRAS